MSRRFFVALALALSAGAAAASIGIAAQSDPPTKSVLQEQIPVGTDSAARSWYLGGFSALASIGSSGKEYWTVTDRGPNDDSDRLAPSSSDGLHCSAKPSGKVIFLPGFNPQLVQIGVRKEEVSVQQRILLHDGAHAATGLANLPGDEASWVQTNPSTKTCASAPQSARDSPTRRSKASRCCRQTARNLGCTPPSTTTTSTSSIRFCRP